MTARLVPIRVGLESKLQFWSFLPENLGTFETTTWEAPTGCIWGWKPPWIKNSTGGLPWWYTDWYTATAGDTGSIPGLGRSPGEGNGFILFFVNLIKGIWFKKILHHILHHTWLKSFLLRLRTWQGNFPVSSWYYMKVLASAWCFKRGGIVSLWLSLCLGVCLHIRDCVMCGDVCVWMNSLFTCPRHRRTLSWLWAGFTRKRQSMGSSLSPASLPVSLLPHPPPLQSPK